MYHALTSDSADMAKLSDENWRDIDGRINTATSVRWARGLKSWGTAGAFITACVAATIFICTQIGGNSKFQGATEEHLKRIDADLNGIRVLLSASAPTIPKNQDAARKILVQARRGTVLPIPKDIVQQAGDSFVEASGESAEVWDVALDFVSYRTSLNELDKTAGSFSQNTEFKFCTGFPTGYQRPVLEVPKTRVPAENGAVMEIIGQGQCTPNAANGPPFLVMTGGGVALDGVRLRHIFLRDLYVQYDGGPAQLEDLTFINCKFGGLVNTQSMNFMKAVLSSTKVTFSTPTHL